MQRGEVYILKIRLPVPKLVRRYEEKYKYVVLLRDANDVQVPFVIASTNDYPGRARAFEVECGPAEGFAHATVIDCRWVYTIPKAELPQKSESVLSQPKMAEIDEALIDGLQIQI